MSRKEKFELFRSLHRSGRLLILPNAWDVATARLFEEIGFKAVATTSAGMMVSLGYEDGEYIPRDEYVAAVSKIAKVLSVPLSVDFVAGFGKELEDVLESVKSVAQAGAVGINIEDFEHTSKKLFNIEDQVRKIREIKRLGVDIFINARTDAFRFASGDEEARFEESIRRGEEYRDAGADCVYPMGIFQKEYIARYTDRLDYPVNIMFRKGIPSTRELEEMHVARLSFGPSAAYAVMGFLKKASRSIIERGDFSIMIEDAITYEELNNLAKKSVRLS